MHVHNSIKIEDIQNAVNTAVQCIYTCRCTCTCVHVCVPLQGHVYRIAQLMIEHVTTLTHLCFHVSFSDM